MKPLTSWELGVKSKKVSLPQLQHLEQCIMQCNTQVTLIAPFDLWKVYENSNDGQMRLYAHTNWQHIRDIVAIIDGQNSKWVYVAINRYLLLCDADPTASENYDQAIFDYINCCLKKYKIVDYQYQPANCTGSIGNFVSPDNRLLCKKL